MFECLKKKAVQFGLNRIKEKFVNPSFEGIGIVKELKYDDKKLYATVILAGLEDRPLELVCEDIEIAPDGSSIEIKKFDSNMEFARNALNQFAARQFEIPAGSARTGILAAKKILGL